MKKLFVAALAVLGFAACSNDEVLDAPRSSAITFDNAIIDNATRAAAADPSTNSNTIENFEVWAFIDRYTGVVFEDENVEKKGSAWVHENAQYWTPNHTYYFAALSPMDSKNVNDLTLATDKATLGLGSFTFTNEDGSEDLLYAKEQVVTGANVSGVQNPVSLKFQHLLSKVKFTFSNGFPTNKTSVVVSEIKMSAPKSATIDLAQADYSNAWVLGNESFNLEFGDLLETLQAKAKAESALERLTIPASADQVYEISFRVQLYYGDVLAHDVVKTSTVSGIALEMGNAYNFQAEITPDNLELQPIEFAVSVDKWVEAGDFVDGSNMVVKATTADEVAAALKSDADGIKVTLENDIDLPISSLGQQTGGSGEYKLGGENTRAITIDLNGKKLNITTTYWSSLGAKNADALFTIKNGTMTSSQATGTWNSYDLTFSNCNYVIEDVVFEKAIAFCNDGKEASLKNVAINETHDYYAMWVSAEGQTINIDGLTINSLGRGIKIDEQYVSAPAKVTLNVENADFNTAKKAAVLVKSVAGAEINLTNVNIDDVQADNAFAVWVDEDAAAHADKVVVNGGLCKVEGVKSAKVDNSSLSNAIAEGNTTLVLEAGDYVIPTSAQGKTLTIIGTNAEDVKIALNGNGGENCDYGFDGSNVTFENITITTNSATYIGYARCNATYKNCIINGTYTLYGNSTFENCTFNVSGNVYNIWTWGAPTATFTNCTFNSDGKALLLYGQSNTQLTVEGCVFNDNGGLSELKAAIEIGNDYNKSYNLVVNNTVVNGYEINDKGINTGTTLWANKNSMSQEKLNVVVDGVDVY